MENNDILSHVYNDLFKNLQENEINVFLCGKSVSDEESLRAKLQKFLEKYPRINLVYPEWLFANLLEKKGSDLLTLENILATDVDKIILPLEGPGSFCELGSFVMRNDLINKLIVINDKKFENKKSFVSNGPLKLMEKRNSGHIFYINDNNTAAVLKSIEDKIKFGKYDRSKRSIINMFSLSTYIGLLIGIFQPVDRKYLEEELRKWNDSIDIKMIDPSIELLVNKGYIKSRIKSKDTEELQLSTIGFNYFYNNSLNYMALPTIVWKQALNQGHQGERE